MRPARPLVFLLAALLVSPLATACRSSNAYDVRSTEPDRATLVVKNENFLDMDIYALSSGLATRVGTVPGQTTSTFSLNSTLYSTTDFRVVASPIGGNGRASSGQIALSSGQTMEFVIGNRLAQSHASIR